MPLILDRLRPSTKRLVMDLLDEAGFDVSDWANFGGQHAASNPKSYNWSFEQAGEKIALCLWHHDINSRGKCVFHHHVPSGRKLKGPASTRAKNMRTHIRIAFEQQLPVSEIIVEGHADTGRVARVKARLLDSEQWAVKEYNFETGEWLLVRDIKPVVSAFTPPDIELSYFEGEQRERFIQHRRREAELRRAKIAEVMKRTGRLICEVANCEFDFKERYGALGEGYTQVHHLFPLSKVPKEGARVSLSDLAVVCANCHAMIHRNGKCRQMAALNLTV